MHLGPPQVEALEDCELLQASRASPQLMPRQPHVRFMRCRAGSMGAHGALDSPVPCAWV
jgi:hypothetical protein